MSDPRFELVSDVYRAPGDSFAVVVPVTCDGEALDVRCTYSPDHWEALYPDCDDRVLAAWVSVEPEIVRAADRIWAQEQEWKRWENV